MYPDPQEFMKDDLTSADALMADGVLSINSTLSSVIVKSIRPSYSWLGSTLP
ncbi:hypothetical protein PI125_g20538 [Phytophthora idaei]|nr:hypothetical protein PI125_g20538 [Phytophthora idaei]